MQGAIALGRTEDEQDGSSWGTRGTTMPQQGSIWMGGHQQKSNQKLLFLCALCVCPSHLNWWRTEPALEQISSLKPRTGSKLFHSPATKPRLASSWKRKVAHVNTSSPTVESKFYSWLHSKSHPLGTSSAPVTHTASITSHHLMPVVFTL